MKASLGTGCEGSLAEGVDRVIVSWTKRPHPQSRHVQGKDQLLVMARIWKDKGSVVLGQRG